MDQPFNQHLEEDVLGTAQNECSPTLERRLENSEKRVKELGEENDRLKRVINELRAARGEPVLEEVKEPAEAMVEARRTEVEERILQYLAAIGVASTHEITSVLGLTRKHAQIYVGELSRARLVIECATPRRLSVLERQRLLEQSSRSWELTDAGRQYIEAKGLQNGFGAK